MTMHLHIHDCIVFPPVPARPGQGGQGGQGGPDKAAKAARTARVARAARRTGTPRPPAQGGPGGGRRCGQPIEKRKLSQRICLKRDTRKYVRGARDAICLNESVETSFRNAPKKAPESRFSFAIPQTARPGRPRRPRRPGRPG